MIALLPAMLMASDVARCADTDRCPGDAALVAALHDFENRLIIDMMREDPFILDPSFPKILGIRDVHCGKPVDKEKPDTIRCVFTIIHPGSTEYEIGELTRKDGRWSIDDQLNVYMPRK